MKVFVQMAKGEGRDREGHDGKCWALVSQRPNKETGYHSEEVICIGFDYEEMEALVKVCKEAQMPFYLAIAVVEGG